MLQRNLIRFWWRGDAGRKVSSGRYEKIYDMGPRAATGDATFATAATRPIWDNLSGWYGLAVDPAATNLQIWSEDLTNATYAKTELTVSANFGIAPTGEQTADKLIPNTANALHFHTFGSGGTGISFVSGTSYTISVFLKASGYDVFSIQTNNTIFGSFHEHRFDLTNGTIQNNALGTATITNFGNGWFRCTVTATASASASAGFGFGIVRNGNNTGNFAGNNVLGIEIFGYQIETGLVPTQYKKTEGTTTAYSAVVAPITDAIPVTGTIIMWDNMVNAYSGSERNRVFGSEDLSTTYLSMSKDFTNANQIAVWGHNNSPVYSSDLLWQPSNQRKRWFFAMTYNGSTVQVYRGDLQGNIAKVIDAAYTPSNAAVRDLYLHSNAAGAGQIGASFLDILTYDDVLTQSEIEAIFYGNIPIFQQTGYAGDFVDKFRQKVQAEPASTYDSTAEATVRADWGRNIFDPFDDDVAAFFDRGIADSATLEALAYVNTQITLLKSLT